jgi:hypothetical protein
MGRNGCRAFRQVPMTRSWPAAGISAPRGIRSLVCALTVRGWRRERYRRSSARFCVIFADFREILGEEIDGFRLVFAFGLRRASGWTRYRAGRMRVIQNASSGSLQTFVQNCRNPEVPSTLTDGRATSVWRRRAISGRGAIPVTRPDQRAALAEFRKRSGTQGNLLNK